MQFPVAVTLPRVEKFMEGRAGAISLAMRDFVANSRFKDRTLVVGMAVEQPFPGVNFRPAVAIGTWFRRKTVAFAAGCARELDSAPPLQIDTHNRVEAFHHMAKRFPQATVLLWFHNDPLEMRGARSVAERLRIVAAGHVVCISEFLRQRFLTDLPAMAAERVHVCSYGIDVAQGEAAPKDKTILYVGRIVQEKGVLPLAEALAELLPRHPGWRAVFIGADRPGDRQLTSDYGRQVLATLERLGGQAEHMAFVPHRTVMDHFARAAVAAIPSVWSEPFGRTAIEAMARRCAIVTSGHGALGEIVGETAVIAAPNKADMTHAFDALLSDPARMAHLQEAARLRALDIYDLPIAAARLDALRTRLSPDIARP